MSESLLHQRDPMFHASQQVEDVIAYLRNGGDHIPNDPQLKITAFVGFLASNESVNDGILNGNPESIDRQVVSHVIQSDEVPESYFEQMRRVARDEGHGDIRITDQMRKTIVGDIQTNQEVTLREWANYLGENAAGYNDEFRLFVWGAVTKLKPYDPQKQGFPKRSNGTVAPYPTFNAEALAKVDEFVRTKNGRNFSKLYSEAIQSLGQMDPELLKTIDGSWKKYDQTDNRQSADELSKSLGDGTGWCIATPVTAAGYLYRGDFHVYYTADKDGSHTVPRLAIATTSDSILEMRGVLPGQGIEPQLYDTAIERAATLPGGERYMQIRKDMQRLAAIDHTIEADPAIELPASELQFLYEINRKIQGMNPSEADPRIRQIKERRDWFADMVIAYDPDDHRVLLSSLLTAITESKDKPYYHGREYRYRSYTPTQFESLVDNLDKFEGLDQSSFKQLTDAGYAKLALENLERFNISDKKAFFVDIIIDRDTSTIVEGIDKFSPDDQRLFAHMLLDIGVDYARRSTYGTYQDSDFRRIIRTQSFLKAIEARDTSATLRFDGAFAGLAESIRSGNKAHEVILPTQEDVTNFEALLAALTADSAEHKTMIMTRTVNDGHAISRAKKYGAEIGRYRVVGPEWGLVIVNKADSEAGRKVLNSIADRGTESQLVVGVATKPYAPKRSSPASPTRKRATARQPKLDPLEKINTVRATTENMDVLAGLYEALLVNEGMPAEPIDKLSDVSESIEAIMDAGEEAQAEVGLIVSEDESIKPVVSGQLHTRINEMLETINPNDADLIKKRFGLDDEVPHSFNEIGKRRGLSGSRIGKIASQTMAQLRHPSRSNLLKDFLD